MAFHQLARTQVAGQDRREQQYGIGHQAVTLQGNADAFGLHPWQHFAGAPRFGSVF